MMTNKYKWPDTFWVIISFYIYLKYANINKKEAGKTIHRSAGVLKTEKANRHLTNKIAIERLHLKIHI